LFDFDCFNRRGGNQAVVHELQLVRTVLVEPNAPKLVHRKTHSAPPTEPVWGAGHLDNLYDLLDPGYTPQLLGNQISLEAALRPELDVLPVTASTHSWPRIGTRGINPVRRPIGYLDRVGPKVGLGFLGDRRQDTLARQAVPDEHDPTVLGSGNAATASCYGASFELQQRRADHERPGIALGSTSTRIGPPVHSGYNQASSPEKIWLPV
jgi:hypothetical protein